jgi:hypothetical protein
MSIEQDKRIKALEEGYAAAGLRIEALEAAAAKWEADLAALEAAVHGQPLEQRVAGIDAAMPKRGPGRPRKEG